MEIIGIVHSDYEGKFVTPRQSGLTPHSQGYIKFNPPFNDKSFFEGIENYTHLWILFQFHLTQNQGWKNQVRPPRLGGNETMGLFATRTNFRPNAIGMSVVKFEKLSNENQELTLHFSNHDIVSGSPVIDIKPYLPYADAIPEACSNFKKPISLLSVIFENNLKNTLPLNIVNLLTETLALDPRPAYKNESDNKLYKFELAGYQIFFRVNFQNLHIENVIKIE